MIQAVRCSNISPSAAKGYAGTKEQAHEQVFEKCEFRTPRRIDLDGYRPCDPVCDIAVNDFLVPSDPPYQLACLRATFKVALFFPEFSPVTPI
jgi:hypothetical protein